MKLFNKKEIRTDNNDEYFNFLFDFQNYVSKNKALQIPIVNSCVDKVCNAFASAKIKLFREYKNNNNLYVVEEVKDYRTRLINDYNNDYLTGHQLKKAICEDYLLGKGAYLYAYKVSNKIKKMIYISENKITFQTNDNIFNRYTDATVDGNNISIDDLIILTRNSKNGISGDSLISQIQKYASNAIERASLNTEFVNRKGKKDGFLKANGVLSNNALEENKKGWSAYLSGEKKSVILGNGLDFVSVESDKLNDTLLEQDKQFSKDIENLFHIDSDNDNFIKNAIEPILKAFCSALNKVILKESEKDEYFFDYDISSLLQGTLIDRFNAYGVAIDKGFMTRNEIRKRENLEAVDGLDMINLSLGTVLLDTNTGNIYTPNTNEVVNLQKGGAIINDLIMNTTTQNKVNENSNINIVKNGNGKEVNNEQDTNKN